MNCPHCESGDYSRLHSNKATPKQVGRTTYRAHECQRCKAVFISRQEALTEEEAAELLDALAGIA